VLGGGALAQQAPGPDPLSTPPGPQTQFPTRFDVDNAPAHFTQVLLTVDFPGSTWTPPHLSGGYVYTTVIEGEVTTRIGTASDQETTYQAGETFVEAPGELLQVGNDGAGTARVISTALLPTHAPLTMYGDGLTSNNYPTLTDWYGARDIQLDAVGPTTLGRSSIEVDRPEAAFELVQLVLELNPDVSTPRHVHGGQEFSIVMAGTVALQRGQAEQVFGAGESWVTPSGQVHAARNDGSEPARVAATFLLPFGKPLTTIS
jgi:quercetin dioxygenase-like cupin family protein